MARWNDPLTITQLGKDRLWRLEQPLSFEADHKGSGKWITTPAGFESDGATVIRAVWWLLPMWGKYSRAAVQHDYTGRSLDQGNPVQYAETYKKSDAIFYDAMKASRVPGLTRYVMWLAVRVWSLFKRGA